MVKKQKQVSYVAPIACAVIVVVAIFAVIIAAVATTKKSNDTAHNGNEGNTSTGRPDESNDGDADNDSSSEGNEADFEALVSINSQKLLEFITKKRSGFVYVGRPTCPHCQIFAPILTKVVNEDNLRVYYYDTDAANENKELKNEVLEAIGVTVVPTFLYIENGVVKDRLKETDEEAALREFIQRFR